MLWYISWPEFGLSEHEQNCNTTEKSTINATTECCVLSLCSMNIAKNHWVRNISLHTNELFLFCIFIFFFSAQCYKFRAENQREFRIMQQAAPFSLMVQSVQVTGSDICGDSYNCTIRTVLRFYTEHSKRFIVKIEVVRSRRHDLPISFRHWLIFSTTTKKKNMKTNNL